MSPTVLVFLRGVISFATLLILARALGKQQLSQLSFFEYITGITIGSLAASLTVDLNSRAWLPWVGLVTWAGLTLVTQLFALRSRSVASFLAGEPVVVIHHGRILEQNMRRNRYRFEELFMQLRLQGIFDLQEVEFAVLETTGQLSVLRRSTNPFQPRPALPVTVVHEGQILHDKLAQAGRDVAWLQESLRRQGVTSLSDVTVAVIETKGDLYVDTYDDHPG